MSTTIDWVAVEAEYRAGNLSNLALAAKYNVSEGAIRKKALKHGWKSDLTGKVKVRTKAKLVRTAPVRVRAASAPAPTDEEIVEAAADEQVAVVTIHRRDIAVARELTASLFEQLRSVSGNREALVRLIEDATKKLPADTAGQEAQKKAQRLALMKAIALPGNAATLRDLSTAMKSVIALERQAFNIGEDSGSGGIEDLIAKYCGQ